VGVGVEVGVGVRVEIGVMVGIGLAAAAVRAATVATCSSGDGPQPINNRALRITVIPIHIFFLDNILNSLLLVNSRQNSTFFSNGELNKCGIHLLPIRAQNRTFECQRYTPGY
jgi:hypothetical protein